MIPADVTTTISGDGLRILLPPDDPRGLVIFCHGSGRTHADLGNGNTAALVAEVAYQGGCLVAAPNSGGNSWGRPAAVTAVNAAYDHMTATYGELPTVFVAASMGGLVSLNTIANGHIPALGWYGLYPVAALRYQYDNNATHTSAIEGAYGFTGAANFDAATEGSDPVLDHAASIYTGLRIRATGSTGDTDVSKAGNADAFISKVAGVATEAAVMAASGSHGAAPQTDVYDLLDFLDRCLG